MGIIVTRLVDTGVRFEGFDSDRSWLNADRVVSVSLRAFRRDQWLVNVVTDAPCLNPIGTSTLQTFDYVYDTHIEAEAFVQRLGMDES